MFWAGERRKVGVRQHCGEAHLHRYLAEFDCRYNRRAGHKITDTERHDQLLAMIEGKRLTVDGLVKPVTPKQNCRI